MAPTLLDTLTHRFGDSLRSIGQYDGDNAEFVYIRDDVKAVYESGDNDQALSDAVLEAMDHRYQESLYEYGDLQCTVRCFEEATELHLVQQPTKGYVVAIDTRALTELRRTIEDCIDAIGD